MWYRCMKGKMNGIGLVALVPLSLKKQDNQEVVEVLLKELDVKRVISLKDEGMAKSVYGLVSGKSWIVSLVAFDACIAYLWNSYRVNIGTLVETISTSKV